MEDTPGNFQNEDDVEEMTYRIHEKRTCSNGRLATSEVGAEMMSRRAHDKDQTTICNGSIKYEEGARPV
jgi:hypothetical protein